MHGVVTVTLLRCTQRSQPSEQGRAGQAESAKGVYSFRVHHAYLLLLHCSLCRSVQAPPCNQSRDLIVCGSGTCVLNIDTLLIECHQPALYKQLECSKQKNFSSAKSSLHLVATKDQDVRTEGCHERITLFSAPPWHFSKPSGYHKLQQGHSCW